jgi:secreted trypsin-like serine protease
MKNVLQLTVLACVFVSVLGCSKKKTSPESFVPTNQSSSIINGEIVLSDNILGHSTVGLLLKIKGTWFQACTGSIIAPNMIMTAAHCLSYVNVNRDNIEINFSLNTVANEIQADPDADHIEDVSSVFNTIGVVDIVTHEKYISGVDYDIAIIRLKKDIPTTHRVAEFLPLSFVDDSTQKLTIDGQTKDVTLLGFGLINENPGESSSVLRITTVPARFEGSTLVTDQTHGTGACNGDSGGPAFVQIDQKDYLVGVTHGPYLDYVTCHEYGVYLNPNLFLGFIEDATKKLNSIR